MLLAVDDVIHCDGWSCLLASLALESLKRQATGYPCKRFSLLDQVGRHPLNGHCSLQRQLRHKGVDRKSLQVSLVSPSTLPSADIGAQLPWPSSMDWRPVALQKSSRLSFSNRLELLRHTSLWTEQTLGPQPLHCNRQLSWTYPDHIRESNLINTLSNMVFLSVLFL